MKIARKIALIVLSLLTFSSIISCSAPQVETKVDTGGPTVSEALTYEGPRARVAVARFDCKAEKCYGRIGFGMADMLTTSLFKSGRFVVLERGEGLNEVLDELDLGRSGYTAPRKAPQAGEMEGADILVIGAITAFEPRASGHRGGAVIIPMGVPLLGGLRVKENEAYIVADLRLVDVRSGRIVNATSVEGRASSYRIGGLGVIVAGNVLLGADLETYENTPMEKAIRVMLDNAVMAVSQMVPADYYRFDSMGRAFPESRDLIRERDEEHKERGGMRPSSSSITGGRSFVPGAKITFNEDFAAYGLGDMPDSLDLLSGDVEIAEFSGKNWMRYLSDGTVSLNVELARDFSIEFKVYKPGTSPSMKFALAGGSSPSRALTWGEELTWMGEPIPSIRVEAGMIHDLAIQNRMGKVRVFLDGKIVASDMSAIRTEAKAPVISGLLFSASGVDIGRGRELLITDIKVAYY